MDERVNELRVGPAQAGLTITYMLRHTSAFTLAGQNIQKKLILYLLFVTENFPPYLLYSSSLILFIRHLIILEFFTENPC